MAVYLYGGEWVEHTYANALKNSLVKVGVSEESIKTCYSFNDVLDSHRQNQDNVATLVIPGGNAVFMMAESPIETIQKMTELIYDGSLNFFGSCAGGILASDAQYQSTEIPAKHSFTHSFSIFAPTSGIDTITASKKLDVYKYPGLALLNITSRCFPYKSACNCQSTLRNEGKDDAKIRFGDAKKEVSTHWKLGPCFDIDPRADIEVIARYTDADLPPPLSNWPESIKSYRDRSQNNDAEPPAAIVGKYGEGHVSVSGVHPEWVIQNAGKDADENLELLKILARKTHSIRA